MCVPISIAKQSLGSTGEGRKGEGGVHTLHPTTIWVAQCSECALGPRGSSHNPSHVPTARCWLCTERCCCAGRGREAAAGRRLQRETQREALHGGGGGGEGPRTAIYHYKTPLGGCS